MMTTRLEREQFDRIAYAHRVGGLTYTEIARQLGCSARRVGAAVARESLRRSESQRLARDGR